jgi:tetratricopeptide (TPR) repeat protein
MMKNIFFIHIISFIACVTIHAQPVDILKNANQAYIDGKYEEAIDLYNTVIDSGYESAALYYNLGNAYFKSNKVTNAILFYERAKLLDPNDDEIEFNLELAKTFTVDKIEEIPELFLVTWIKAVVHALKVDAWAFISIACFIAMLLGLSIYFFSKGYQTKRLTFLLAILLLVLSIVSYSFAAIQKNEITRNDTAIVFAPTITLKSSPDRQSKDLFVLHEGTKVVVVDEVGEWREIKLADGSKGWLKISDIEII